MNLTENFTLEELIESQTATRFGINNNPSQAVKNNLTVLAEGLEKVRKLLGHPMLITSGFCCMELNRKIGGSDKSAHMMGYAADFVCPKFGTPKQIVDLIKKNGIQLDQCIEEGTWVHISFAPAMRNQFLKATFRNGKAQYSTL